VRRYPSVKPLDNGVPSPFGSGRAAGGATVALAAGTILQHRYRIESPAGQGGMGTVYRATDLRLDATVAIKHQRDAGGVLGAAFEREAQLLAALRHPVLPKVTDYFLAGDDRYLVMEYVAGEDLATLQRRARQPFPAAQVLAWADQVLDALSYLHGHEPPVLHRDIKPANLKPTSQGGIALLDFGLAKRRAGAETSVVGYTLTYAPPEQISGTETTGQGDLYALAATFYDLLGGKPPTDAVQRLAAVEAGEPDPLWSLHDLNPEVPVGIALALEQALALAPERRPATAEALRELLRRGADERATVLAPASPVDSGCGRARTGNLPTWLEPLIGRQREVTAIQDLLAEDSVRLVTLTGPGGSGKTRLAVAVASCLTDRYRDGVWFVDLAPITDPDLAALAIASTLGVRERGSESVFDGLREHLRAWESLLVLDNFEQVLAAGRLIPMLLMTCPGLRVLVTSREPLRVRGEHEYPVSPLPLPEAVALFVERARAVKPDFAATGEAEPVIADICARLDGLPLAIELAAARTRLLPPGAMLARLERRLQVVASGPRDLPARQQTLRRTIDWSYDLLSPDEQQLFARLAVFVGGRSLEAIEAVCNADGALGDGVLDGVESLVGKSLLRQEEGAGGEPRLTFLETINEYARERLEASGEGAALRRLHAAFFLALAEEAKPRLVGPQQGRWLARLVEEYDNLRAAMAWARDAGETELWLRLAGALWRYWEMRFHLREGRAWLEAALAADTGAPPAVRARALNGVANLTWQSDLVQGAAYQEEALALFRAAGDDLGTVWALNDLANIVDERGDYSGAIALYEESLALSRKIGAAWEEACALHNLALAAGVMESYERAATLLDDALIQWERLGDEVARARSLDAAAQVARDRGDLDRALALGEEGLALRRRFGDRYGVAVSLVGLGWTMLARGDGPRATGFFHEALPLHLEAGDRRGMASCLTGLARLLADRGHPDTAARLLAAADAFERADGAVPPPARQRRHEQITAAVAAALSGEAFTAAWAAGSALSPEQAAALALAAG
jgi:predicted ATPase